MRSSVARLCRETRRKRERVQGGRSCLVLACLLTDTVTSWPSIMLVEGTRPCLRSVRVADPSGAGKRRPVSLKCARSASTGSSGAGSR